MGNLKTWKATADSLRLSVGSKLSERKGVGIRPRIAVGDRSTYTHSLENVRLWDHARKISTLPSSSKRKGLVDLLAPMEYLTLVTG